MHHVYFQTPNRLDNADIIHAGPHTHGGNGTSFETKHWPLCCTAALTRILPGFVQWMWMKPRDGGLAAVLYGPNTLETDLGGTAVRIETTTDYPFHETLQMRIEPAQPLRFPLKLRVPEWCANPSIAVNGDAAFSRVASETRPDGQFRKTPPLVRECAGSIDGVQVGQRGQALADQLGRRRIDERELNDRREFQRGHLEDDAG